MTTLFDFHRVGRMGHGHGRPLISTRLYAVGSGLASRAKAERPDRAHGGAGRPYAQLGRCAIDAMLA